VGTESSPTLSVNFRQLTDYPRITLSARYAPQYAASGDDALIDGLRGNESFKSGRWQGYRGTDLEATVDFGQSREVTSVGMGFIQDVGSWILMPRRIVIQTSEDGVTFRDAGAVGNTVSERERLPTMKDFVLGFAAPVSARYVRVRVVTFGTLPDWHPGAGEAAWFFADEIVVR
jgi:hypothetical protein